jgi:hypothetical protein
MQIAEKYLVVCLTGSIAKADNSRFIFADGGFSFGIHPRKCYGSTGPGTLACHGRLPARINSGMQGLAGITSGNG